MFKQFWTWKSNAFSGKPLNEILTSFLYLLNNLVVIDSSEIEI